jgi:uncharacterized Zn-binding protein involved in type VI secretion
MPAAARLGDPLSCHPANVIVAGSPSVFFNGIPVARIGDATPGHPGGVPGAMITGNPSNVYANGIPICIIGSIDSPHGSGPHIAAVVTSGSPTVFIGS